MPRYFPEGMMPPPVSPDTVGFWESCKRHRLAIQRCNACGTFQHPPGPLCHRCRSRDLGWQESSGHGRVYSYTSVHKPFLPSLAGFVPYNVAVIELEDAGGTRIVSNVVGVPPDRVTVGMEVTLVWDDFDGYAVPRFVPA